MLLSHLISRPLLFIQKGKTMSDYIKREDAVILMARLYQNGYTRVEDAQRDVREYLSEIPSADVVPIGEEWERGYTAGQMAERREHEWIPCKERLPEDGDDCIVTGKLKYPWETEWNYFVDVASNDGDYIDCYWDTFKDWDEGQEVHIIAWMPLPSPYQPKERSRR